MSAAKPGFNNLMEKQQAELRELYMDPLAKIRLEKERKLAKEIAEREEEERIANLPPVGMTEDERTGIKALFDVFDDGAGKIHLNKMGSLLVKLGLESATDEEIKAAQDEFDLNKDGFIDFREFVNMAQQIRQKNAARNVFDYHSLGEEELEEFKTKFNNYDEDQNGSIDQTELKKVFVDVGMDSVDSEQLEAIIGEYDKDGNGVLVFNEFVSLYSRLRALQSDNQEEAQKLRHQWVKKCSHDLKLSKRARQAATAATKKALGNGKPLDEVLEIAKSAAWATKAASKEIDLAVKSVKQKALGWLNKELFDAAEKGDVAAVSRCLQQGDGELDGEWAHPERGLTALMVACESNRAQVVEVLAEAVDVDWVSDNTTAVKLAATHPDCRCLKALLKEDAYVGTTVVDGKDSKLTPVLVVAAQFGNTEGVKLLMKANASINDVDAQGMSALMAAAAKKQFRCCAFIVEECAPDLNLRNHNGNTVVDILSDVIRKCPQQSAGNVKPSHFERTASMRITTNLKYITDEIEKAYENSHKLQDMLKEKGALTGAELQARDSGSPLASPHGSPLVAPPGLSVSVSGPVGGGDSLAGRIGLTQFQSKSPGRSPGGSRTLAALRSTPKSMLRSLTRSPAAMVRSLSKSPKRVLRTLSIRSPKKGSRKLSISRTLENDKGVRSISRTVIVDGGTVNESTARIMNASASSPTVLPAINSPAGEANKSRTRSTKRRGGTRTSDKYTSSRSIIGQAQHLAGQLEQKLSSSLRPGERRRQGRQKRSGFGSNVPRV